MKAAELATKFPGYQKKYQDDPRFEGEVGRDVAAAMNIIEDLIVEAFDLIQVRGMNSTVSVFKEIRIRWEAVVRRLNNPHVKVELFDLTMDQKFPCLALIEHLDKTSRRVSHRY